MPIRTPKRSLESPGDPLVEPKSLPIAPLRLEAIVVEALLPPEHQRLRPAKMVLVHRQAKSLLFRDPDFESFSLSSLLASLQAGRAGKSTLLPSLSIPSHKRSARHAAYTGGKGCFTQWGNGEFIVITEAIHPHFTQWVNYDYFSNVPTNLPTF